MNRKKIITNLCVIILIYSLFGCNDQPPKNVSILNNQPKPTITNNSSSQKIKIKSLGGADLFSLKQNTSEAKLVDGNNQELVKIKVQQPGKIKFKTPSDQALGYIITEQKQWKLQKPDKQDLYILKLTENGDYHLEDAIKKKIYQIKSDNNSWEIKTPDNLVVYRVKIKEGKISLINSSQTTVFYTKSSFLPIAFACFGFDVLTREQQAALAYTVNLTGGK
jgi:hypothetical protein